MKKADPDIKDEKFINSFFIIDNSNRGLWISRANLKEGTTLPSQDEIAIGSKLTGAISGDYNEGESGIPCFWNIMGSANDYTTKLTVDNTGCANGDIPATYPYTKINDVNTIAYNNDNNIVTSSFGVYLNSIIEVPGTIKRMVRNIILF